MQAVLSKNMRRLVPWVLLVGCAGNEPEKIDAVSAPQVMAARARQIVGGAGQAAGFAGEDGSVMSRALRAVDDASSGLVGGATTG